MQNIQQNTVSLQGSRRTRHSQTAVPGPPDEGGSWPVPAALVVIAPRQAASRAHTTRLEFEVFATLTLFTQNKLRSSSSLPAGRGNSGWREEERKSFGAELLLGRFARGGTAAIACCDSRPLFPRRVLCAHKADSQRKPKSVETHRCQTNPLKSGV